MAPIKKKTVETLENLSLKTVLSSVVADLYLSHLLSQDLRHSFLLTALRVKSSDELLKATAQRLQILPGLLNDQVRDKLIKEFFSKSDLDKWPNTRLDLLKVLLNDSVTSLSLGARRLPHEALTIIGESCPDLTSLQIVLNEPQSHQDFDINEISVDKLGSKPFPSFYQLPTSALSSPLRKRRKLGTTKKEKGSPAAIPVVKTVSFQHLTEASILHGASDDLLAALGQSASNLRQLKITYSFGVTDNGVKSLCLKNPENHTQRRGCQLHELRVRSFHLNPCCQTLREIDTVGTYVTQFGVAFLLKHLPVLRSLGDCNVIAEALEVLVGSKPNRQYTIMPTIRRHATRYKLSRMKEERLTQNKFLLLTSLCPDLKELSLGHSFREVDLGLALESLWHGNGLRGQMGRLKHLKQLSLLNVHYVSVRESIKAVGHQLTDLHIFCKGLDLPSILETCINLTSFTLEGSFISAPYEALEMLRSKALTNLETVKIKSVLPSTYMDLIISNSKKLKKIDICNLGDIGDSRIEHLVNYGHFNNLNYLIFSKASQLTIKSASSLVHKCPKLAELSDLGQWNITCDEYCKLQNEVDFGHYDIKLTYGVISREADSDDSSADSDYPSDIFDAFRNIFPVVII